MAKTKNTNCRNCGGKLVDKLTVEHEGERDDEGLLILNEEGTAAKPFVVDPKGDVLVCPDCGMANPKFDGEDEPEQAAA